MSSDESDDYKRGWHDGYKAAKPQTPVWPDYPNRDSITRGAITCAKCGMKFEGVVSYYCTKMDCPTFLKAT